MKNIIIFNAEKYNNAKYSKIDNGIYKLGNEYYTSLSFVQETNLGEGNDSSNISQYPLEDILDCFNVYVSDFYEKLNNGNTCTCYLEFASLSKNNIEKLLGIVGKHVYVEAVRGDDTYYEKLCIE